jgi:uncharacterized membrane protein YhdT
MFIIKRVTLTYSNARKYIMFAKTLLLVNVAIWSLLAISGVSGYLGIVKQGVSGYPNSSQMVLYLIIPICMTLLSTLLIVFYKSIGEKFILGSLSLLFLVTVLPYIIIARGGV